MFDVLWNKIQLCYKKVKHGERLCIRGKIYIHGAKKAIAFGDNVTIFSSESINPTSGFDHCHFTVFDAGRIEVGNNVGMSHVNICAAYSVKIDDNVMVGSGVKIWDTDFHPINYKDRMCKNQEGNSAPIHVKSGAFIGACSIILKGVTIGERSVIGAGSVVTKNVPDDEIWGGNPAKFIKKIEMRY